MTAPARFFTVSDSTPPPDENFDDSTKWAIARAMSEGVIIMASTGNTGQDENDSHLSWWSGVVGVAAVNNEGGYASDYSSWGRGVTVTAVGGPVNVRAFDTGKVDTSKGTSVSTAIASGLMALARQKWPDATSNQLLQSLIHTGLSPQHEWNHYTGYGPIDIGALVNTDPSQYPDENPVIHKSDDAFPTAEMTRDYKDGRAVPQLGTPAYEVTGTGPDHQRVFTASAIVDGRVLGQGTGSSKKVAEHDAAEAAYAAILAARGDGGLNLPGVNEALRADLLTGQTPQTS